MQNDGLSRIEAATLHFYQWEQRCRGWQVFEDAVELEPIFEPYFVHANRLDYLHHDIDDAKKPTILGKLINLFTPKEEKPPVQDEPIGAYTFKNLEPLKCFGISLSKGYKVQPEMMQQLLLMISSTASPVSFEIIANYQSIRLQFVCQSHDAINVYSQFKAYFPEAGIQEYPEGLDAVVNNDLDSWIVEFGLQEEFMRPIKMADKLDPDPYIGIFGHLEHIQRGEQAAIQILFHGAVNPWAESVMQSVCTSRGEPFFVDAPEMLPMAKEKISTPLYGVVVRVIGQGNSQDASGSILERVGRGLMELSRSGGNSLIPLTNRNKYLMLLPNQ